MRYLNMSCGIKSFLLKLNNIYMKCPEQILLDYCLAAVVDYLPLHMCVVSFCCGNSYHQ